MNFFDTEPPTYDGSGWNVCVSDKWGEKQPIAKFKGPTAQQDATELAHRLNSFLDIFIDAHEGAERL